MNSLQVSNNNLHQLSEQDILKTGTTCLALRFDGGVIIAADKRMSAGYRVGKAKKIHMLTKDKDDKIMGLAIAGLVSDAMSLVDLMRSELKLYKFENGYPATTNVAATLLGVILHSGYRRYQPYWTQLIVAGQDKNGGVIFSVDPSGAVSKDDYIVIGSGSLFALSKIEDSWKEGLTKDEAKALAIRAIKLAASRDLYTGDGIMINIITEDGVEKDDIDFTPVIQN